MGTTELRVDAAELHRLSVACAECTSAIVFEASAARGPGALTCPNCSTPLPGVIDLVAAYRDFFRLCTALKDKLGISLVVTLPD